MKFAVACLVACAVTASALLTPSSALAHGNFDQSLEGDPGCNTSNFAASTTAASGQRQTFVPTGSLLASVALCASATSANTPLILAIYTQGGTLIGGGSTASNPSIPDAAGPPVRWVHVDFIQPYAVTPGATYIVENVSGIPITWYGTASGSPYSYCLGAPNTSAVGDYGFQSFLADDPGASAACPEPPTATPVPPTNTPLPQPTNTPSPGETIVPTNTPAPGVTSIAQETPPAGVAPPIEQPATTSSAPIAQPPRPTGRVRSGSFLPNSGTGSAASSCGHLPLLILMLGLSLLTGGLATQRQSRRRR